MAKCKGCGAEIIWAVNENGKKLPLDARAPVYVLTMREGTTMDGGARCQRAEKGRAYVTHFATCPKANEFSGSKKK